MTTLSAILIDDEPNAIEILTNLLAEFEYIQIENTFSNPIKALPHILRKTPDIIFLDIRMPELNGLEFLKDLSKLEQIPNIIMVTAYEDYILDAFRNNAFDYLLKPIDRKELSAVVDRVRSKKNSRNLNQLINALESKIKIPGVYETYFLNPEQILYISGDGKYSDIFLSEGKKLKTSLNLGKVFEILPNSQFKRISKSIIINSDYLYKLNHRNKTCMLTHDKQQIELNYSTKFF